MLVNALRSFGGRYVMLEYGELPGTFSINKDGIFSDSYAAKAWIPLDDMPVKNEAIGLSRSYLRKLVQSQSSSRGYSNTDSLYLLIGALFEKRKMAPKIIYVSGVELVASGYLHKNYFGTSNPNKSLLAEVCRVFNNKGYILVYKDHPLTQSTHPNLALNPAEFPDVIFMNNLNVDNLIELAEITITLPSKVAITNLLHRKKVYVYGDFTIPHDVPSMGYYSGISIADVEEILSRNIPVQEEVFAKLTAYWLENCLVSYEPRFFDAIDLHYQTQKIERLVAEQTQ